MERLIAVVAFIVLAPLVGGLLAGVDRMLTARMQRRVGPPIMQPFYDVLKLLSKESLRVNNFQNFYIFAFLVFAVFTGGLFFGGGDLLLVIFAMTVASIFFVLAGYSVRSPYSHVGTERELLQMMSYEPMVLIAAIGMYMVTKSFNVWDIVLSKTPLIVYLPGIFIGFVYVLTIKLRKSPFDLSTSHHGHQEIVKGITTEFSGPTLAMIEIAHWYENVLILGMVYLFFGFNPILGAVMVVLTYLAELVIDNSNARFKWQLTLASSWLVALVAGLGNIMILYFLKV